MMKFNEIRVMMKIEENENFSKSLENSSQYVVMLDVMENEEDDRKNIENHPGEHESGEYLATCYKCDGCNEIFSYQCQKCNRTFKYNKCLRKHILSCNTVIEDTFPEKCPDIDLKSCENKKRKTSNILTNGLITCGTSKTHVCMSKDVSKNHKVVLGQMKTFQCNQCDVSFKTNYKLNRHCIEVHDRKKKIFECKQCKIFFKKKDSLRRHLDAAHKAVKSFRYAHSNKKSVTKKLYKCKQCKASFPLKRIFDKHMLAHLKLKKFHCNQCEISFTYKYNLNRHNKNKHVKTNSLFKCETCNYSFGKIDLLKSHVLEEHENPGRP